MELTVAQRNVMERLEKNTAESFLEMCEVYPDPYQAAAALHCTRPEMEQALSPLFGGGPTAWMSRLPIRARAEMRKLEFVVY